MIARAPEIVAHRVNDIDRLSSLPEGLGAEIDIRSKNGDLILSHEPHQGGPLLAKFLKEYARARKDRLLILNPKEDGLDAQVFDLLKENGIVKYFFLDLTYPAMVRLSRNGDGRGVALRVSEYESAESAGRLAGKVGWVWCDCFEGRPLDTETIRGLRESFKVCLVSPELEGYAPDTIADFKSLAGEVDAVCTKHPERWA